MKANIGREIETSKGLFPSGEIIFIGLTTEQLKNFTIIPEGDSNSDRLFTPTKNGTYKGDGFYTKNFDDKKYWYKVSGAGSVEVTVKNGQFEYNPYQDYFGVFVAAALGKDYWVGFKPKSEPHHTTNP